MTLRPAVASLLALLAVPLLAAPTRAMWTHDLNANLPICTHAGGQTMPFALADGAGGMFVAWTDFRNAGTAGIYMQHVNAAGATTWTADGVPVLTAPANPFVTIGGMVPDGAGGVILVWSDHRGSTFDAWAQRVSGAGSALWAANGVSLCTAAGDQSVGAPVPDGAGGAIVAWSDGRGGVGTDLYAQHVDTTGAVRWGATGLAVSTAASNQFEPAMAPDGAGGAIVAWSDLRNGSDADLYAQHLSAAGAVLWATDGIAVSAGSGDQTNATIATDGLGGAIVAWSDARTGQFDLFAQHLTGQGVTLWAVNGVAVCTAAGDQFSPVAVSDGLGGAYVTWIDSRTGEGDLHTQELSADGVGLLDADNVNVFSAHATSLASLFAQNRAVPVFCDQWTSNRFHVLVGTAPDVNVTQAGGDQQHPAAATDGNGGVLAVWDDSRSGVTHIYAQRVDRYGFVGDASPVITGIADVPGDQGGMVTVTWQPSYLDIGYLGPYRVWRQVPTFAPAAGAASARRATTADPDEAARSGKLWSGPSAIQGYGWEFAGSVPATGTLPPSYSLAVPTAYDSIGGSNPLTTFLVQATQSFSAVQNWNSAPDSGYSVDNLAPATPSPLAGSYAAGVTSLHWPPDADLDLAGYRVYRGASPGFTIGPANRIAAQSDTALADAFGTPAYYQVTAVDVHGNESAPASFPNGTTGVGGPGAARVALAAPAPNPARLATLVRYALARPGPAQLEVFDTSGRRVRVLRAGRDTAGEHAVPFALEDDSGRPLASGLYLVRLQAEGLSLTRRFAVVR